MMPPYYTHVVSDSTFVLARYDAALLEEEKQGHKSDVKLTEDRDIIGAVAQYGVYELIESWGFDANGSPFYIPGATFDTYDLMHRGQKIDIKGTPYSTFNTYLIKQDSPVLIEPEKHMDLFCFVSVELDKRTIHVAGVISRLSILNPRIHTIPNTPYPAYSIHRKHLHDFKSYIFGV
jgi:hypothetical protein